MEILAFLRNLILGSFQSLPLILIGFLGLMSLILGNLGMGLLFIGHVLVVPVLVFLLNLLLIKAPKAPASDLGLLVPSEFFEGTVTESTSNPSYWVAHVVFFFSFLLTNVNTLQSIPPERGADPWKVENRKAKMTAVITITSILLAALLFIRFRFFGTETPIGMIVGILAMGGAGIAWYNVAAACGARNADIFGVVQQMLSRDAKQPPPMTCVYNKPKSAT